MKLILLSLLIVCMTCSIINSKQRTGERFGDQCCAMPLSCKQPGVMCTMMCRVGVIDGNGECVAVNDPCNARKHRNHVDGIVVERRGKAFCLPYAVRSLDE
jgi:hypothetical protein